MAKSKLARRFRAPKSAEQHFSSRFPRANARQPTVVCLHKIPPLSQSLRFFRIRLDVPHRALHVLARTEINLPPRPAPNRMIAGPALFVDQPLPAIVLQESDHLFSLISMLANQHMDV